MSRLRPWQAYCAQRFIGSFYSLADAKDAADRHSKHPAIRAAAKNTVTGERWFRGRGGWIKTAAAAETAVETPPMPPEVDR